MTTRIPARLADIDDDWLREALTTPGQPPPPVAEVRVAPIDGIVGAMGEVAVVTVGYDQDTDLPGSFVAKAPLDDDMARVFNQVMQSYIRESGFYQDLAARVPMRVPACHVNLVTEAGDEAVLVIEHCADDRPGDLFDGCDLATMVRLAADLGRLHGQFWDDASLTELTWLPDWRQPAFELGIPVVQDGWRTFQEREPDAIPAPLARVLAATWVDDTTTWLGRFCDRPWTLVHGDYELDNLMFGAGDEIVVLDWQTTMRSFPGFDLGWFIACCGDDEIWAAEDTILDAYRDELAAAGGPAWSREDLVEDMAWGMVYHLTGQTVTNSADFADDPVGRRARDRFRRMFDGCLAAALRWDTAGRIGQYL